MISFEEKYNAKLILYDRYANPREFERVEWLPALRFGYNQMQEGDTVRFTLINLNSGHIVHATLQLDFMESVENGKS